MGEQEKLHGEMHQMWEIYKKCMPDVASAYDEMPMEVYKEACYQAKSNE